MSELYKVYKSSQSGHWEYDLMTPDEQAMDARSFPGLGWIGDRRTALNLRNEMEEREARGMSEQEPAQERSVDLIKRDEWRLVATPAGFALVLEAGGLVYSFPLERARAADILSSFTNAEYTIFPIAKERGG